MVTTILDNMYVAGLDKYQIGDNIAVQTKDLWPIYQVVDTIPANYTVLTAAKEGKLKLLQKIDPLLYNTVSAVNPTPDNGAEIPGARWFNYVTSETFVLQNKTINGKYLWIGDHGTIISDVTYTIVDIFNDKSGVALYPLNSDGTDLSGRYNGQIIGNLQITSGLIGNCALSTGLRRGQVRINNLPFNRATEVVTVSMYAKWTGERRHCMLFGWDHYDLDVYNGWLGFNTAQGDLYGFNFSNYLNEWVHITAVFRKGQPGEIFLNGEQQTLIQKYGYFSKYNSVFTDTASIFGWNESGGWSYCDFGYIDTVRMINRGVTADEALQLYKEKNQVTTGSVS